LRLGRFRARRCGATAQRARPPEPPAEQGHDGRHDEGPGRSNTEIADQLCISGVTVKSHIGRIFGKLDLRDRAAAIVYAYDNGIVAPR
jgi:hypothetical protein